jgi:hypothetical protein
MVNQPFLVEGADCLFECFFTDPEQVVDLTGGAFVGNGHTAATLFYGFQNVSGKQDQPFDSPMVAGSHQV